MKKLLAIIILSLSIFGGYNSVLANDLTCSDDKNSHVIKINHKIDDSKKQLIDVIKLVKNMLELLEN